MSAPEQVAVDTSALMALLLGEPEAEGVAATLASADALVISAATLSEALIVAARRGVGEEMERLIEGLGFEVEALSGAGARRVANAHARWGRGRHPAGLDWGDCFAHALVRERGLALLYVGDDFARTDLVPALA